MQVTGIDYKSSNKKSIRLVADGFSFYPGREVILVAGRSTWLPLEHFNASQVESIYNKVYPPLEIPQVVRYSILPLLEVVELWSVGRDINEKAQLNYPHHRWMGVDGAVVERLVTYERQQNENTQRLYAYMHDGELFVFSYRYGSLFYANSFWPKNDEEIRYFMFNVWNTLKMDVEKDECLLIDLNDKLEMFTPYLRHVGVLTPEMIGVTSRSNTPFDILCL